MPPAKDTSIIPAKVIVSKEEEKPEMVKGREKLVEGYPGICP